MDNLNNITIPITKEARNALNGIEKKYGLAETPEEIAKNIKERKLFKMNLVVKLTRELMMEKVSNKEFLDALHKDLQISKEATKSLGLDIANDLIPLLKKFTAKELESYLNLKKAGTSKNNPEVLIGPKERLKQESREELLRRINANRRDAVKRQPAAKMPYAKKPVIENVEKNAENMAPFHKKPGGEIPNDQVSIINTTAEVKAPTEEPEETKKFPPKLPNNMPQPTNDKPDPYKEPVE